MINSDLEVSQGLSLENPQGENVKKLAKIVEKFLSQGERLVHAALGSEMIVFQGTADNGVVAIQAQGGGSIRQLIIRGVEGNVAYEVYCQQLSPDDAERFHKPVQIEKFTSAVLDEEHKDFAYNQPAVVWSMPDSPAPLSELPKLINLLERTKVSPTRQTAVVSDILRRHTYRRPTQPALQQTKRRLSPLPFRLKLN